jgi:hypothetical protein
MLHTARILLNVTTFRNIWRRPDVMKLYGAPFAPSSCCCTSLFPECSRQRQFPNALSSCARLSRGGFYAVHHNTRSTLPSPALAGARSSLYEINFSRNRGNDGDCHVMALARKCNLSRIIDATKRVYMTRIAQ